MRFILVALLGCLMMLPLHAAEQVTAAFIDKELKQVEANKSIPNQVEAIEAYRRALNWVAEQSKSISAAAQYQKTIDNYDQYMSELNNKLARIKAIDTTATTELSIADLEQKILQTNSRLIDLTRQAQTQRETLREIGESLIQLPQQQSQAAKNLYDANKRLQDFENKAKTELVKAQETDLLAEIAAHQAYINELTVKQLSAANRQAMSQLNIEITKTEHLKTEALLENLRAQLTEQRTIRQRETEQQAKELAERNYDFPEVIKGQLKLNQTLAEDVSEQARRLDQISTSQRRVAEDIVTVRRTFNTLREQAQWLNMSTTLGQIQRAQLARLPKMPARQPFNQEMAQLRVTQLSIQNDLRRLEEFQADFNLFKQGFDTLNSLKTSLKITNEQDIERLPLNQLQLLQTMQEDVQKQQQNILDMLSNSEHPETPLFSNEQITLLAQQLNSRYDLLTSLQAGSESLIIELTQLSVLNNQLSEVLTEVREAANRYLFWVADVEPLTITFPIKVISDLNQLISLDTFKQLKDAFKYMFTSPDTLMLLIGAGLLVIFGLSSRRHYKEFLDRAALKVGKVTQDSFTLTIKTVLWSVITALPLPILWGALSYGLQQVPDKLPIAIAIGTGINATLLIMWAFMISASFAHPKGLFITQLGWSPDRVSRAMRYYKLTVWLVVPLTMGLISFDSYSDAAFGQSEFAGTLGRSCFFLLCGALVLMTTNLHKVGIPIYLNKEGSGDNAVNHTIWTILRYIPIIAAIAAGFGYLATSQALLARLDMSVVIWFGLLIIYHIIRRWMLIQRRRIEFDRAKHKRAERLAQRAKQNEEDGHQQINSPTLNSSSEAGLEIEEPVIDLDAISAQSLKLVRSILTMVALVSVIALWSEMHSAFSFLENIKLWDVTSTIQGVESNQAITLGSLLIAVLIFIVTAQLVRNLPALLELAILQHLDLNPGTGYAITTLTKYILMTIGGLIAFSMMGVDWSKLQFLIAALGVGLGFGLQEIFANFISGLIILFEKPIRINDMVTIRELTGTITKINTRATTIVDWDRKEIIVPNKAFITEQFVNWSLSDSITRIVITVPAEIDADPTVVTDILKEAADKCSLVMDTPQPDAFLVDIQQGIQLFELRVFAAEMGHRMPLRHELHQLIIAGYRVHHLELPFPPFQVRANSISRSTRSGIVRAPYKTGDL